MHSSSSSQVQNFTKNLHVAKVDTLKGVAILAVFAFHLQLVFYPHYQVDTYKSNGIINVPSLKSFLLNFSPAAFGWTGVDLFLIISGFLIHLGYLTRPDQFTISSFYSKRFWRIYPPYFVALLFFCFTLGGFNYYFHSKQGMFDFISHALLIHNFFSDTVFSINGSFWSLALEVQLYAIYPLFLALSAKFTTKKVLIFFLILSQLTIFVYVLLIQTGFSSPQAETLLLKSVFSYWSIWVSGAYLAELYFTKNKVLDRINSTTIFIALFIFVFCRIVGPIAIFIRVINTVFWCLIFSYFLKNKNMTMNSFGIKFLSFLGLCSYSFYLLHQPFLGAIINFFKRITGFAPANILAFLFILSLSYISYRLIEQPSINLGIYLRKKRTLV